MPDALTEKVLFCPFCGEAFEGLRACPEHELALVPWRELPSSRSKERGGKLEWYSPGLGRGWLALGAALSLGAFLLPFAHVDQGVRMGGSMLALALHSTPKLWLVPAAAWAQLAILYRRTSVPAMRGARLAALLVACVPATVVALTWSGARGAVAMLGERSGQGLRLEPGAGTYLIALSTLLMLAGAYVLGGRNDSGR